ncbi:polyprenyl synthetase family protein [Cellulophaga lytica]|uniref:Geranyltranstransferase n=1 Tax=Cellulophaga lytica (strain ATCC 23178 / DSM 7489 / JCM 8516 / NBRC 14961 / NCIMB 1423 / VKM B-1433 / Cy l20) TaxID=867900 RepID=F0RAV0_CELLC|nr:polyprenyl synthetase family protein [Cellulophaga lytica]ADY29506.1 Geranyltranstransferase [Cellulophaga lytica DSM 7489]WQG76320.1 polyprenyl synthetase family protein [Cellulophaga lytica]
MHTIDQYRESFLEELNKITTEKEPKNLYEPINYILQLGGKRLRPILALMTADVFETDFKKAIPAAMAVEVFHNFSLVHDDIMDDAPLRRGKATVHEKWDINTGILSGDAMLIEAYRLLEQYDGEQYKKLNVLFSTTALQVCEGQQYDVDFETRDDVTIPEYLKMIEYKTAVLVAAAMKMGAIIAETTVENEDLIYDFGKNLGIAFQLQDDYLDAFGDPKTFGKQVGGDIIENKKTYLYLKALELSSNAEQNSLDQLFSIQPTNNNDKIATVKVIFEESKADVATKQAIEDYTQKAFNVLDKLEIPATNKEALKQFGLWLMTRKV